MADVTRILSHIESGDASASQQLLLVVYDELRKLAAARLAQEKPDQTLEATALVHEAYVRLMDVEQPQHWNGRGHFFAAAAEAMRRILVEQARQKKSQRRGGQRERLELNDEALSPEANAAEPDRILAVHEALAELETQSPRKAQLVKLRFFAGMTLEEAASSMGVAIPTAKRDWAAARVWLFRWLSQR